MPQPNLIPQIEVADHAYMTQALRLAQRGLWTTHPNPRVGCVIVRDGEVVGEGWHQVAGGPHAEIYALEMAQGQTEGATCYITLEPCCHYGKTPPCTEALIKAGISRAVVAMRDPNPLVGGKGIEALQKAGIVVNTGILGSEAEALNVGFIKRMRHGMPYVRCKMGMSLDGRTAMASGESQWITSAASRRDAHGLRARSNAILTGAGTVIADNPSMTVRARDLPADLPPPEPLQQPLRVVIDAHLSTPATAKILKLESQTLIFTASGNKAATTILENAGARVICVPGRTVDKIDLTTAVRMLAEEYAINEILLETGATLSGSMLREQLIDEIVLYISPIILGNRARGLFDLPHLEQLNQQIGMDIQDIRAIGQDCRITARPLYA